MKTSPREDAPRKRLRGRKIGAALRSGGRREHGGARSFEQGRATQRQRGESLGGFAYRVMREALRSGTFKPGEHLREADVAQWLSISRTPVREAFHRLIAEGLLADGPWSGVMVAELEARELIQLYAIREALEGTAAALAARHATETEVRRLFEIAAAEARAKGNPQKLVVINSKLHQAIYAAAHNRYLLQSVNTIVDALGLLRHSTFVLPGSAELAHREHLQIIKAIRDRRPAEAERKARQHVRHALAMRLELPRAPR
jgi:DNA-binding GntR family transcriptional regulator